MEPAEVVRNGNNPFKIRNSEIMGRYMVASRIVKPGELIVTELPIMVGPPLLDSLLCLGCFKKLEPLLCYRCPICRWPLCSSECKGIGSEVGHGTAECQVLAEKKIIDWAEKSNTNRMRNINEILFILRCLSFKHSKPDKWKRLLTLESHNDKRKEIPLHWYRNEFQIVNRIRKAWLINEFSDEEIHSVCGIIKVNCFGIGSHGLRGRALYPTTSMFCHDCQANARVIVYAQDFSMAVRASREIKPDETISISYVDMFMTTLQRRELLNDSKYFWCVCERCSDPSEFGTNCNALFCRTCSTSSILSTNSLDQNAAWRCYKCERSLNANVVYSILTLIQEELEETIGSDVPTILGFINRYNKILGEKHYLILYAKYAICQRNQSDVIPFTDQDAEEFMLRREAYCKELLNVVNKIAPGQSRMKGILMFELYMTTMILTGKKVQKKELTRHEFRKVMADAASLLQESEAILRWEPIGSMSRKMAEQALSMLI